MKIFLLSFCCSVLLVSSSPTPPFLQPDSRIVGGFDAPLGLVPWQASLRYIPADTESFGYGHFCGGILISPKTVLTAAHCLVLDNDTPIPVEDLQVVGGDLNRHDLTQRTFIGDVEKTISHESFDYNSLRNDIGLVIMKSAVPVDHETFRTVPLATVSYPTGTPCLISGWGSLKYNGEAPALLQAANVEVYDFVRCRAAYGNILPQKTLCAGVEGGLIDACQGDSGGPLVCNGFLTGIVSAGYECARPNFPGIYTDVLEFTKWIEENQQ